MTEPWFLLMAIVCAGGVALALFGEYLSSTPGSICGKLLAASAYLGAAFAFQPLSTAYGRFLLAGLAVCWLGDLLLISRRSRRIFLSGLGAFLLGHLLYSTAFVVRGLAPGWLAIAAIVMSLFAVQVARWLSPHLERPMKLPVRIYIVAISAMAALAVGTVARDGGPELLAGAILFLVSDLGVARNRFVAPGFVNRAWGLPAYFAGQLLLVASLGQAC